MYATCYGKTTTDTQLNLLASSFFQLRNELPKNVVNFQKNFQVVGLAIISFIRAMDWWNLFYMLLAVWLIGFL